MKSVDHANALSGVERHAAAETPRTVAFCCNAFFLWQEEIGNFRKSPLRSRPIFTPAAVYFSKIKDERQVVPTPGKNAGRAGDSPLFSFSSWRSGGLAFINCTYESSARCAPGHRKAQHFFDGARFLPEKQVKNDLRRWRFVFYARCACALRQRNTP